MPQMVTVSEWARRHHYSQKTAWSWAEKGQIVGAIRVQDDNAKRGFRTLVPEDASVIRNKPGRPPAGSEPQRLPYVPPWKMLPPAPVRRTKREISRFIMQHSGSMTYGQLSRELGLPTFEVRRIYDRLHDAYGI